MDLSAGVPVRADLTLHIQITGIVAYLPKGEACGASGHSNMGAEGFTVVPRTFTFLRAVPHWVSRVKGLQPG